MRYLSLALFAEGPSDHAFLQRIIYRSVFEIAARLSDQPVEIPEQFVRGRRTDGHSGRVRSIPAAFADAIRLGAVNLLFIHTDAGNDAAAALNDRVTPGCLSLHSACPDVSFGCIAVVPIRETEAWALADADALREEWGTRRANADLGLPLRTADVEGVADPKATLRSAQHRASSRRIRARNESIPAGLGDRVNLNVLRQMSAFTTFESCVEEGLKELWQIA